MTKEQQPTTILIGTTNQSKYETFRLYLGDEYNVVRADTDAATAIPEGTASLVDNAITKARTWCKRTGQLALADDTGLFIKALGGQPGVAFRRWGGELPETATNADFWHHLQTKLADVDNTRAYVEQCVAVAAPSGNVQVVYQKTRGYIDKTKLAQPYNGTGYPLAAAFIATDRSKTWDDMTNDERLAYSKDFIADLKTAIAATQ